MSSCICADGIVVPCERETHTHTQILDIIETISESCATQTHYFSTIDFYFSPPTNRKLDQQFQQWEWERERTKSLFHSQQFCIRFLMCFLFYTLFFSPVICISLHYFNHAHFHAATFLCPRITREISSSVISHRIPWGEYKLSPFQEHNSISHKLQTMPLIKNKFLFIINCNTWVWFVLHSDSIFT